MDIAIKIGSDELVINSLLPLVVDFSFKKLYESALNVIKENCCNPKFSLFCVGGKSQVSAEWIFAYSRLTKAVHCPMMQASSVLLGNEHQGAQNGKHALKHCQEELQICNQGFIKHAWYARNVTMDDDPVVKALGYFNILMSSTMKDSIPWELSLTDLSYFIASLQTDSDTNPSNIVYGLKYFVLMDFDDSEYYLLSAINDLHEDHDCQTILKLIVAAALYAGSTTQQMFDTVKQHLHQSQVDNLNLDCYLGVMNDIIIPFLNETQEHFNMVHAVSTMKDNFLLYCIRKCNSVVTNNISHILTASLLIDTGV